MDSTEIFGSLLIIVSISIMYIYFDMGFRRAEKNLKNILENLAKQQPNEKPES